jgi:hypothetical protein
MTQTSGFLTNTRFLRNLDDDIATIAEATTEKKAVDIIRIPTLSNVGTRYKRRSPDRSSRGVPFLPLLVREITTKWAKEETDLMKLMSFMESPFSRPKSEGVM